MKRKSQISAFFASLGAVVAVTAGIAHADVTTEQKISIHGVGMMAAGNMSGTTTTAISGNKSRTDSDLQLESKIVRFLARNALGPTSEIVNLDADKIYHLNVNKKEYTEQSFEELRTRLQNALAGSSTADKGEDSRPQPSAIDQSKCEWLEPKTDVKKTGEKGTFAGFDAERVVITAEQPCKDKETGAICEIALTLDEWMAPGFGNNEEVTRYRKAYAQKVGLDSALSQDSTDRAKAMFAQYKGAWSAVAAKMKDLKGYPVKSSFGLALGGDQCKQAQSAQQQSNSGADNSSSSSDSTSTDIAGKVGAKLGSLFHKKQDDSQTQTAAATPPAATGPSGTITLMTVTTELVSVSTSSIPADSFDVPAGYKKVEQKGN